LTPDTGCHLVAGVVERAGATLYCTALFFGPTGAMLGRHRKLMPTAAERVLWGLGDASTMPAVPAGKAVLGAAICWENYMPLFRAAMYAKGVTVWCAPTVDDRPSWQATMRHVATEGRCFVLSACQYLRRSQLPSDLHPPDGDDLDPVLIGGGSVIVSPLGEVLAGPAHDGESILVADIDLDDIPRARFDLDVTGHYARTDLFTLLVDEQPRAVVRGTGSALGGSGHDG
jgi:nitrilase